MPANTNMTTNSYTHSGLSITNFEFVYSRPAANAFDCHGGMGFGTILA